MLDRIDYPNTTAGDEEEASTGQALQHEIMMDLLVTVSTFGAIVTLIIVVVQSFL